MNLPASQPDSVYRVSKGMRTLAVCFLVPLIAVCCIGPVWLLVASRSDSIYWLLVLLGLFVAALFVYLLRSTFLTRLEFLADSIRYTKGWGQPVELHFDAIDGYRIVQAKNTKRLVLVPKDRTRKPVKIELVFERAQDLGKLLASKFRNLDQEDYQAELTEILTDQRLGFSEEQRLSTLKRARNQAQVLNIAAVGLLFWGMIYPRPYDCVMLLLALCPVLAICFVIWSHGVVGLDGKKTSARPNVAGAFISPGMILALRAFLDWHILDWSGFWAPFALMGGAMLGLAWYAGRPINRKKVGSLIAISLFCLAHGYGLVVYFNCAFDRSKPLVYRAVVQSREISHGKHTSYYLTVSPWLGEPGTKKIDVGSITYGQHPEGSQVLIGVRPGTLAIQWFLVR